MRRAIIAIIAVLVALCAFYAVALGGSIRHLQDDADSLTDEYGAIEKQLAANDVDGALESAKGAVATSDQMKAEAGTWQWDIAACIPYYGQDVSTLRTLLDVSDTLANDAALPVVQSYRNATDNGVIAADGTIDAWELAKHADEVPALLQSVRDAGDVVSQCSRTVSGLPPARTSELAKIVAFAQTNLSDLNDVFAMISAITSVDAMADTAKGLLGSLL